ncbi:MAG: GNAT family N-acetyltransferase [Magnetospirillum sp.]|nr:GNAT family N-acetyltransferase [Magnetospirillum sp.]
MDQIIRLDSQITATPKPAYWHRLFEGCQTQPHQQFFLVAKRGEALLGFIAGEIRAWEFGSPPCGWIFAIAVDPDTRLEAIGSALFEAVCGHFRQEGVTKVRTMIARDAQLVMSFFRSQGMMAGPFIELEKEIDE